MYQFQNHLNNESFWLQMTKSELKLAHVLEEVYKDAKERGAGLMNSESQALTLPAPWHPL